MTCWKDEIEKVMKAVGDDWGNVVYSTLSEEEANREFDCGFGGTKGVPFTLWTKDRVYFPVVYDGAEWAACVPRNPIHGHVTYHVGGE